MRLAPRRASLLALAAALTLGGCVGDGDDVITTVDLPRQGGNLFTRYVALGNSITAGFQSGGINDSTQTRSYVALLAQRAGVTSFGLPLFNKPGCPAPYATPLGVGAPAQAPCAGRSTAPAAQLPTQNLAVPGVRIADLFTVPVNTQVGQLYTLITGGRSQVQAMREFQPSFVTVWIGNNDALDAATRGRLGPLGASADSLLTPLPVFQEYVRRLADSIRVAAPLGAMLVGVVDPVTAAPILQPGAYFFAARNPTNGTFFGKTVNNNCSPVNNLGQPNPLSRNLVSFRILADATVGEINCDPSAQGGAYLLDAAEVTVLRTRIQQYNAALQAAATANNWIFANPNTILAPFINEKNAAGLYQRVRKCQDLATATLATFEQAVLRSCPVIASGPTDPRAPFVAPNVFGSLISFDAVHPSSEAHRILAGQFAQLINAKYGTTLSTSTT